MTYAERICTIAEGLDKNSIPYSINHLYEGWQLRFPWSEGDIACHRGTYESEQDKVESYCFSWDEDDVSVLTCEEAIEKITAEYENRS